MSIEKGPLPKHESPKTPEVPMAPPEKREARGDSEYFSAVSRYFNGRKDMLKTAGAMDTDDLLYADFLTEQQNALLKLANQKTREKIQPTDVAFALAELSGTMAANNVENPHNAYLERAGVLQEHENVYLDTRTVYMESCKRTFPDVNINNVSPSELCLQLRNLKKVDLAGNLGGSGENPMVEVLSISEIQRLLKEDPKALLGSIDEVLYWVGNQMKDRAIDKFKSFHNDDEREGTVESVRKEEVRLGTLAEPMYKLQLIKDELLKKVYGNANMKPSERMKADRLLHQLKTI